MRKFKDNAKILKHFKILPTTFISAGGAPFVTTNKKILTYSNDVKLKMKMKQVPTLERR